MTEVQLHLTDQVVCNIGLRELCPKLSHAQLGAMYIPSQQDRTGQTSAGALAKTCKLQEASGMTRREAGMTCYQAKQHNIDPRIRIVPHTHTNTCAQEEAGSKGQQANNHLPAHCSTTQ